MPNRPLYIIMWSDKWPNTLTSVQKLANVVGNWPVANCYFELWNIHRCIGDHKAANWEQEKGMGDG